MYKTKQPLILLHYNVTKKIKKGLFGDICLLSSNSAFKSWLVLFISLQVIDYYNKKGVVANLPAEKPPQDVTSEVKKALS